MEAAAISAFIFILILILDCYLVTSPVSSLIPRQDSEEKTGSRKPSVTISEDPVPETGTEEEGGRTSCHMHRSIIIIYQV
jgi:hypothetical protein